MLVVHRIAAGGHAIDGNDDADDGEHKAHWGADIHTAYTAAHGNSFRLKMVRGIGVPPMVSTGRVPVPRHQKRILRMTAPSSTMMPSVAGCLYQGRSWSLILG